MNRDVVALCVVIITMLIVVLAAILCWTAVNMNGDRNEIRQVRASQAAQYQSQEK